MELSRYAHQPTQLQKKYCQRNFFHIPAFLLHLLPQPLRPCLPARLQRAMQHRFDQTYDHKLWFSLILELPLVTKTLQVLGVEMGPQLEGKMRGPRQKHRCI